MFSTVRMNQNALRRSDRSVSIIVGRQLLTGLLVLAVVVRSAKPLHG